MSFALLIPYAVALSLTIPSLFFIWGPVRERRLQLGFSYATAIAIAWGALLPLGFLSRSGMAAAAATLITLAGVAAIYAWRDERLLARFDARLGDPSSRAAGLEEIYARLDELAHASRAAIAVMELAGWPTRRLIARGCYSQALQLLEQIEARVGGRLTAQDQRETRLLRAHTFLHLGRVEEASELLERDRSAHGDEWTEASLLRALLSSCARDPATRLRTKVPGSPVIWLPWNRALSRLVKAHLAVTRGDEAHAAKVLSELVGLPYGDATLDLARALPGPASDLAAMIERPSAPYR